MHTNHFLSGLISGSFHKISGIAAACILFFVVSSWAEDLTEAVQPGAQTITVAQLSDLEGTAGHQGSSLSDLEGEVGHADPGAEQVHDGIICPQGSVCLEEETQLPLRVLPRPFSHIYSRSQAAEEEIVQANVPAFHPLYVFARQGVDVSDPAAPTGWYQVGQSKDAVQGWMQSKDVMEWRQALLVSYTHPGGLLEGRNPVLMFRSLDALQSLVDSFDMADQAQSLYTRIEQDDIPDTIVSMEPQRFVDITKQFYILPILQWEETQIMGDDVRLLQLAAAVPAQRGADTLQDEEYRTQAQTERGSQQGARVEDILVDIVFAIDTTRSMQPFIDMTKDAVARMVGSFTQDTAHRFRFGLVGYRDDIQTVPELEYDVRNFTPELVDGDSLVRMLDTEVKATQVGSLDYAEEVFAGVDAALRSSWRENALRFMILIGDASGHPKGHAQNITGKDQHDLRREADDAQVHILAIHLQDPRAGEDHPISIPQFAKLAQVRGSQNSALTEVNAFEQAEYQALVDMLVTDINTRLNTLLGIAPQHAQNGEKAASKADTPSIQQGREAVDRIWEAALIEYLGQAANPPKDIVAWAADRDLVNPADKALDVRVLVTRDQLNSLAQALDNVIQAFMRAEVTQMQFFEALQSVSGQAMKRPEDMGQASKLADTGMLPAFIKTLPYKSDILALSDEMFGSMTAEQRSQLEWNILAKLEQYRTINEQVDAWFRLNETDPDRDMVYPLHLDYLP
ncbi:MAG: vWA domain-containing protein [Desulfovermiculus sp.]|nr:vWA domain-containing protein [Desulfovermiculus sp.]